MGRRTKGSLPAIRKHKKTGYFYIFLNGKRRFLCKISEGIVAARNKYFQIVQDIVDDVPPPVDSGTMTINDVCERFLAHAELRYRKHDRSTGTAERYKMVLRPVKVLFGQLPVSKFGLGAMIRLRNWWLSQRITRGGKTVPLSRTTVNDRMSQTAAVFARARQWGIVPKEVLWDIRDLQPLREFETAARETEPVRPAKDFEIEAVIEELRKTNPVVADMMTVHSLTGCRSSELCLMRPGDIEKFSDGVWEYEPSESKTEHHRKGRIIPIGPKAQAVLAPYMTGIRKTDYIFSPKRAAETANALRVENASTHKKYQPVEVPKKAPGDKYTQESYRRCVQRAAARVGVKITPHQLRHSAATNIDQKISREAAKTVLGHSTLRTTDIYADYNRPLAHQAAKELG